MIRVVLALCGKTALPSTFAIYNVCAAPEIVRSMSKYIFEEQNKGNHSVSSDDLIKLRENCIPT